MKWYKVFNSHRPKEKQDPLTAFMLGSALVGGIGSAISTSDTNAQNKQLAREARDWQSAENQKNRDFTKTMWDLQNEYNTPANQRKLAEEGGYNPYLIGEDSLGSTAGAPAAPSMVGAPDVARVSPVNPAGAFVDSASQLMPLALQSQQIESNIELQRTKSVQALAQTAIDAYDRLGSEGYSNLMDKISPVLSSINMQGSRSDVLFEQAIKNFVSERYNKDMDSLLKELQYNLGKEYNETQIQTSLSESNARIASILGNLRLNERMTEQQIKTSVATMVKEYAAAWNLRKQGDLFVADAKTVDALRGSLKKQLDANVNRLLISNGLLARDYKTGTSAFNWLNSEEGQQRLGQSVMQNIEWNGSQMGFVLDKIFGNYIKIGGSANYNYGVSSTTSTSDSHSVVEVYK